MDQTALFRANLQSACIRDPSLEDAFKSSLLPRSKSSGRSSLHRRAVELSKSIYQLAELLEQQYSAYVDVGSVYQGTPGLLDAERHHFEEGAQNIINVCSKLIDNFRRDERAMSADLSPGCEQLAQHQRAVADILHCYFTTVCNFYNKMKTMRSQRVAERMNITHVKPLHVPLPLYPGALVSGSASENDRYVSKSSDLPSRLARTSTQMDYLDMGRGTESDERNDLSQLSSSEIQMLEAENELMLNELNNMTDEVRLVESKVIKVSQLQDVFTENVLQQDKDIDRISDLVSGGTENIKQANDELHKAIKTTAGLRVWVLLFLLVMSFTLLFLDWYKS